MKKLLAFSLSMLSLFTLTGCTNSSEASLTTLENQVKRVESIITKDYNNISSVSPEIAYDESSPYSSIYNLRASSYENMARENLLKEDVLSLNNAVKASLEQDIKLNKNTSKAVKDISSNISANLSKYNETKSIIKNNVKSIKKSLKSPTMNTVGAESNYLSLNGEMNARYVYLCNIYDNLEQAYILITDNTQSTVNSNRAQTKQTEDTNKNSRFRKNIDSYAPDNTEIKRNNSADKENENIETRKGKNIDSFNNAVPPSRNRINNGYGYNNPTNGYGYGYPYNGYANGYAYPTGYRRFHPLGNTDTFYPYNRNVDTYRPLPNTNYPVAASQIDEKEEENLNNQNGVIEIGQKESEYLIPDLKNENSRSIGKIDNKKIPDEIPKIIEQLENKDTEF